jgi:hypothetical protein
MGSIIVSRGSASDLKIQYKAAIIIPIVELLRNASIKVTTAAVMEHILEVKRSPNLSYINPVRNLKQARVNEPKLAKIAINVASIPTSFI